MTGEHCVTAITSYTEPVARLIVFPHAGGSSTSYRRWARHLGPDIELSLVEYPGHGTRMGEPLVEDHMVLVEEAVTEIAPADVSIALLGHRTWTDEDLAAELVGYRGTPAEFMRDPATQDMLIRILRLHCPATSASPNPPRSSRFTARRLERKVPWPRPPRAMQRRKVCRP